MTEALQRIGLQGVVAFALFLGVLSCGEDRGEVSTSEEQKPKINYYKLEAEKLDSILSENDVLQYRAIKSALMALGAPDDQKPDFLKSGTYDLVQKYAFMLLAGEEPSQADLLQDALPLLTLYNQMKSVPAEFYDLDPSDYPTLLESASDLTGQKLPVGDWNPAYESTALAFISRTAEVPERYTLYELAGCDVSEITDDELAVVVALYQAVVFMENGLPYHADSAATNAEQILENTGELSGSFTRSWLMDKDDPAAAKQEMQALVVLVRGLALSQMPEADKQTQGTQKLKEYITLHNGSKHVNEWSIIAQGLTAISSGDNDGAMNSLSSIQDLSDLSMTERANYLSLFGRSSEDTQTSQLQNVVIAGVILEKLNTFFRETDFYANLMETDLGSGLMNVWDNAQAYQDKIEGIKGLF